MRKFATYFLSIVLLFFMSFGLVACGTGDGGNQGGKINAEYNQFKSDIQTVFDDYSEISGSTTVTTTSYNSSSSLVEDVYQYIASNSSHTTGDCKQMVNSFLKIGLAYPLAYGEYLANNKGYDTFFNIVGTITLTDQNNEKVVFKVSKESTHYIISMCSELENKLMSLVNINYISANNYTFVWSMISNNNSMFFLGDSNRNLVIYTYMEEQTSSNSNMLLAYNGNSAIMIEAKEEIRPESLIESNNQTVLEMNNIAQELLVASPAVNLPATTFDKLLENFIDADSPTKPGEDDPSDNPGEKDEILVTIIVDNEEIYSDLDIVNDMEVFKDICNRYDNEIDENYEFSGWFLNQNLTEPFDINNLPTKSFTIYGKLSLKKSSVIFVMLDGRQQTLNIEQGIKLSDVLNMAGVPTFGDIRGYKSSWSEEQNFEQIDYDKTIVGIDPIYIYEYSSIITYNISYYGFDDLFNENPTSYNIKDNFILQVLNDSDRPGYQFDGWYNGESKDADKIDTICNMIGDLDLYARWSLITYNITYINCNNYINNNPTSFTINDGTITLQPLQSENALFETFEGWKIDGNAEIQNYFETNNYTHDITITAVFTNIRYHIIIRNRDHITFDPNKRYANNEYIGKDDFSSSDTFVLETPITDIGYSFGGYTLKDKTPISGITTEYLQQLRANNETDIYLDVILNNAPYTISYFNIYEAINPNPTSVTRGDADVLLQNPDDRLGYEFGGWYYFQDGNNQAKITSIVCDASITEIYASWTAIEYTITYINEYGDNANNQTTYTIESNFDLLDAEKSAYNFLGWFDADNNKITTIAPGRTGNLTLTAKWEEREVPIKYIDEITGEEVDAGNNPKFFTISSTSLTFSKPNITHRGYQIADMYYQNGMNTKSVLTESFNPIYLVNRQELVIYISWSADSYYVKLLPSGSETNFNKYTMNDGKMGEISIENVLTLTNQKGYFIEYNINSDITLPIPTLEGFTFLGWFDNNNETANQVTKINADLLTDVTYYGKWQANQINVIYHANNGTDITSIQTSTAGEYVTIQANEFNFDDYCFIGWDISASATESDIDINIKNDNIYQPNSSYAMTGSDLHLYAIWSRNVVFEYVSEDGGYFKLKKFGDRNATTYTIPSTYILSANKKSYPVKVIGDGAFEGKSNLKSISGLTTIEKVGNSAFKGCTGLTQPLSFYTTTSINGSPLSSLKSIGAEAFSGVMVEINLGTAITELGPNSLAGYAYTGKFIITSNIKKIHATTFGRVVYSTSGIQSETSAKISELEFMEDVEVVKDYSYEAIDLINLVKLTATTNILKYFGNNNYCSSSYSYKNFKPTLKEITIFDHTGVSKMEKPTTAGYKKVLQGGWSELTYFWNVERVKIDYWQSYFTEIGDGAFKGLINLKHCFFDENGSDVKWKPEITRIGASAFENCYSFDEKIFVSSYDALTEIGDRAFANCMSLKKVNLSGSSSLTTIGEGILFGCTSLESIELPFIGKQKLTESTPSSTQTIASWIFGLNEKDTENPRFTFVRPSFMLYNLDGETCGPFAYDIVDMTYKITNVINAGLNVNGFKNLAIYSTEQLYIDADGTQHDYYCYMPYSLKTITITGEMHFGIRSGALYNLCGLDMKGNNYIGPEIKFDQTIFGTIQSKALSVVKRANAERIAENYETTINMGFVKKIEEGAFENSFNRLATLRFYVSQLNEICSQAFRGCSSMIEWYGTNKNSSYVITTASDAFYGYNGSTLMLPYEIDCIPVNMLSTTGTYNIILPRTTINKDGSEYALGDDKFATYIDVYNTFPSLLNMNENGTLKILSGDITTSMFDYSYSNLKYKYKFSLYVGKDVTNVNLDFSVLPYLSKLEFEDDSTLSEVNMSINQLYSDSNITLEDNVYYFGEFAIGFSWDNPGGRDYYSREFTIKEGTKYITTTLSSADNKSITKLYVPTSVKYIRTELLTNYVESIYYAGTQEQWENIAMGGQFSLETDCKRNLPLYILDANGEYVLSKTYNKKAD